MITVLRNRKIPSRGAAIRKPRLRLRRDEDDPEFSPDRHEARTALHLTAVSPKPDPAP